MQFLRTNTAVIVTVGPFFDKTDGVTIETGLTITNERITLTADTDAGSAPTNILDNVTGATSGTANDLNYITGNDAGMMQLELAAADVNRVGRMFLSITDAANHVPVFHEFFVLPQAIYDWLTGVIVPLPANVTQLLGTALLTPGVAGTPDVNAKLLGATAQTGRDIGASVLLSPGTGTGQVDMTSGVVKANLAQILGTALTETAGQLAAAFKKFFEKATPTGTINSIPDAVAGAASGLAIVGSNMGTATSVTGAVGSVTGAVGSVTGAVGSVTGAVGSFTGAVGSVTAGVTVTTNNDKTGYGLSSAAVQAIWDALTSALVTVGSIGKKLADWVIGTTQTGDSFARLGAPAGASVSADVAAVKVDTAAILVDTGTTLDGRIPAALVGGRIDASVGAMAANVMTAAAAAGDLTTELQAGLATAAALAVVDGIVDDILVDTAAIGAAGAGLTDLGGMSTTMKAQVQTEAEDALVVNNLDHLLKVAAVAGDAVDSSIVARLASKSATPSFASFVNTTDALEAIRDKETDIETDTTEIGAAGAGLPALGDTRLANLDATVSSRTKPADTQARVTLVDTLTTYTGNTPQTGDVFPLASTEIADIKAKTDNLPSDPADESLIIAATDAIMTRLGVPAVTVSADIAAVKVDTAATLLDTGTDGVVVAAASKTGYALSAAGVTAVWAEVVEGAITAV